MKENKKLVLWILGGIGAAAFTYAVYQLLKEQKPKKKIEFAPVEEKKELKWLAEEKKRKSGELIEEKKSGASSKEELSVQATQKDKSIKSTEEKKNDGKAERPKTPAPKTKEFEKIETPKEAPAAPSPLPTNPNTPTKGVSTANEIKSEYFPITPTKMLSQTQPSTNSVYLSATGSSQSTPSSACSSNENQKSSKRSRLSKKRRRNSQRSALTPETKKDPEEELLKATKEDDSKDDLFLPKLCECKRNQTGLPKDDEQLFDAKIKYKMEQAKIDVDYYPYQPINLLTPIEGESELCREAWDVSTFLARPDTYLSPLEAVLDIQKCAAMQAEIIDKMIKYGDYEEGE